MKKLTTLVLLVLMLTILPIRVFAATDTKDDLSHLTDEIINTANDLLADKLKSEVTVNDINYDNAYKIYVGIDVFQTDTVNVTELQEKFGADGYIYELPIYIDGSTILVNIAKGQTPDESVVYTDKERKEALSNVGKWQVTAIKYYSKEIVDYKDTLLNKVGEIPNSTILVGGLPYFKYAVALIPDEKGDIQGLVPMSAVPGESAISHLRSINKNVYNFEEIKEYINQLPAPNPDEAGGYGFLNENGDYASSFNYILFIGIVVVLCIAAGSGVIIMKRKNVK